VLRREDVVALVLLEALTPALAHPRLGGEVEDDVARLDQLDEVAAREVERDELEPVPVHGDLEVAPLVGALVVVVEAVDADHLVTVRKQGLGQVRPDEAGAAGDESSHGESTVAPPESSHQSLDTCVSGRRLC
jgi:hypothetical protein